jgi:Na+/H+-dicarboxylate symporter
MVIGPLVLSTLGVGIARVESSNIIHAFPTSIVQAMANDKILQVVVMPQCLTGFRLPWQWGNQPFCKAAHSISGEILNMCS